MDEDLYARVQDGQLRIEHRGVITYDGEVQGRRVDEAIALASTGLVAVLTATNEGWRPESNLVALTPAGDVAWIAELPHGSGECYVAIENDGREGFQANSWGGYRVVIDPHTGKITSQQFVK